MTVTEVKRDGIIELNVEGRVDTNTSPQLQQGILQAFQKGNTVVINLEKVDYVSSSGLRALLIGQKTASSKGGVMKLTNVCEGVMKVLNITGFVKMLTIE